MQTGGRASGPRSGTPLSAVSDKEPARIIAHISKGMGGFFEFRRRGFPEGNDLGLDPMHIEVFDEGDEVAVAGGDNHRIELRGELYRVDRNADIPVGLLRSVRKDLQILHFGLDADLGKRFEEVLLV